MLSDADGGERRPGASSAETLRNHYANHQADVEKPLGIHVLTSFALLECAHRIPQMSDRQVCNLFARVLQYDYSHKGAQPPIFHVAVVI